MMQVCSCFSQILQGVDFPNVKIVCTVGLPGTLVDALQRAGRVLRNSGDPAIFVLFYESWVHDISLDEYKNGDISGDPDRPRSNLKPNSRKQERAPYSSLKLVKSDECIRLLFAQYLGDKTPEGTSVVYCFYHPQFLIQWV